MRAIPAAAADFVAVHEGLRLQVYEDPAGVLTIGYGHTGPEVHGGLRIDKATARAWLTRDLEAAAKRLETVLGPDQVAGLEDGRYIALLSLVFNVGCDPRWTIWKRIRERRDELVPSELMRFVHVGGRRLPGLASRRAAEAALWVSAEEAPPPSSFSRAEQAGPVPHPRKPLFRSRTAVTGAAQLVGGASAGALAVQQTLAPYAQQAAVLSKLVAGLAVFLAGCGVVLLAIKWLEHREAAR